MDTEPCDGGEDERVITAFGGAGVSRSSQELYKKKITCQPIVSKLMRRDKYLSIPLENQEKDSILNYQNSEEKNRLSSIDVGPSKFQKSKGASAYL